MMSENNEKISKFNKQLTKLINKYKDLKEEYNLLESENIRLNIELKKLEKDKFALLEKYQILKMSKNIEASVSDVHNAKIRITRMVREIDECIALLNR